MRSDEIESLVRAIRNKLKDKGDMRLFIKGLLDDHTLLSSGEVVSAVARKAMVHVLRERGYTVVPPPSDCTEAQPLAQ